jgi:hypothetical protein
MHHVVRLPLVAVVCMAMAVVGINLVKVVLPLMWVVEVVLDPKILVGLVVVEVIKAVTSVVAAAEATLVVVQGTL